MKKISYLLLMLLLPAFIMTGCSNDDDNGNDKQIEMPNQSEQTQQAYADDETSGGFTFTSKSTWTATITENSTANRSAMLATKASTVSWLRLLLNGEETYNGSAGTFTLTIELDTNYSGVECSASITIKSGNDEIVITVTQDGKTEDGTIPDDDTRYVKQITGAWGGTTTYTFDYDGSNRVSRVTITESDNEDDTMTFTYGENSVSYVFVESDGSETITCTGTLTLNSNGYASKGEFLCNKKDRGEWSATYTSGYLTNVNGNYEDGNESETYNHNLTWSNGNMTYYESTTSEQTENATLTYSSTPNNPKINIDLNWMLTETEALAFIVDGCADAQTLYPFAMGLYGKRSEYMVSQINSVFWGETNATTYTYLTDSEGFITQIQASNGSTYQITYR